MNQRAGWRDRTTGLDANPIRGRQLITGTTVGVADRVVKSANITGFAVGLIVQDGIPRSRYMQHQTLSQEWQDWVAHNLGRGCAKEEVFKVLVDNGFSAAVASKALQTPPPVSPPPPALHKIPEQSLELVEDPTEVQIPLFPLSEALESDKAEVFYLRDFLSEEECVELSLLTNQHLRVSTTTNDQGEYEGFRTSRTCDLGTLDHRLVVDVERRISQIMGISSQWGEPIQAQRYEVGQQFKAHTDYFEPDSQEFAEYAAEKGQRTWTFMVYLNTTLEGGETHFPSLDIKVKPRRGDVVIWNNLKPDGSPNPNTLHAGTPVSRGYKVVLTKWFRDKGTGPMLLKTANECIRPHTKAGFLKVQVPKELMRHIHDFERDHSASATPESVPGFIDAPKGRLPSELMPLTDELKTKIHQGLLPLVEAWTGTQLEPTFVFGIRRYLDGAVLKMHRDRGLSHVVSAIINVTQDVRKPWPLEIEDHHGRHYHVLLEPGEMVFYEGARLLHGRPQAFEGKSFSNIFVHYKLPLVP